jgi:ribosome-binding factor A
MSVRSEKLASILQAYSAEFFEGLASEKNLITVVGCDVNPDGKSVIVWLTVHGPDKEVLETAVLRKATPLRKYFASKLSNRYVPYVTIQLDTGNEHAAHISELIKN